MPMMGSHEALLPVIGSMGIDGSNPVVTRYLRACWGTVSGPGCIDESRFEGGSGCGLASFPETRNCSCLTIHHHFGTFWVMRRRNTLVADQAVARTIRFPAALRDQLTADATRCGRSFEGQVIALLR